MTLCSGVGFSYPFPHFLPKPSLRSRLRLSVPATRFTAGLGFSYPFRQLGLPLCLPRFLVTFVLEDYYWTLTERPRNIPSATILTISDPFDSFRPHLCLVTVSAFLGRNRGILVTIPCVGFMPPSHEFVKSGFLFPHSRLAFSVNPNFQNVPDFLEHKQTPSSESLTSDDGANLILVPNGINISMVWFHGYFSLSCDSKGLTVFWTHFDECWISNFSTTGRLGFQPIHSGLWWPLSWRL